MMISKKNNYEQAFVWLWLPNATEPIVAGKLQLLDNNNLVFNYGANYLARTDAIAIYEPELPLQSGILPLISGLSMPSCIRDASPDAWGRRVIINKIASGGELEELTYLLESGSDRIGALDFQLSASEYIPRLINHASLEELLNSATKLEQGKQLTSALDQALFHASSIGGARPKALITEKNKKYIAKFSSASDLFNVIKTEFIAMRLASLAGLNVAKVKLVKAAKKDVLLVERFDREFTNLGWIRKCLVSALTLFSFDEMMARYASYEDLAEIIRKRFVNPEGELKQLFSRLVFNILCSNTDDHARNHAAFWNGKELSLTPAYDICPQGRTGNEASQAMLIHGDNNLSQIKTCLTAAHNFLLTKDQAYAIVIQQKELIEKNWHELCDEADLSTTERKLLWQRQFLNPYAFVGL